MNTIGQFTGELCNRNGCTGIIEEHEKDGSCSCHSNPPCSYCVDDMHFCPVCGWEGLDDQREVVASYNYVPFKVRTIADLDPTKIDYISSSHTHFSMIKEGVYPEGTTRAEVAAVVNGTFGGRFERFGNGRFKFIAYTD